MTIIKTIDASKTLDGKPLLIEISATGHILIDGRDSHIRPIVRKNEYGYIVAPLADMPATVAGWIWANSDRLPKGVRIGFTAAEIAAGYAAAKDVLDAKQAEIAAASAKIAERRRLEREWDALNNEGGDGYNPYRETDLAGTAFDRRERHYPEGA